MRSVAKGMPAESIAPVAEEHEAEIAELKAAIRKSRPVPMSMARLHAALEKRMEDWRSLELWEGPVPDAPDYLRKCVEGPHWSRCPEQSRSQV